jgi:hypothetical protein
MKLILCALLVAALPFGRVLADAPKAKDVKVTLVYQHELPNVPGKSIKGVLVEYGPDGYSPGPGITSPRCPATATASAPRQRNETGQAPRSVRGQHERYGIGDPLRELRSLTGEREQHTLWTPRKAPACAKRKWFTP